MSKFPENIELNSTNLIMYARILNSLSNRIYMYYYGTWCDKIAMRSAEKANELMAIRFIFEEQSKLLLEILKIYSPETLIYQQATTNFMLFYEKLREYIELALDIHADFPLIFDYTMTLEFSDDDNIQNQELIIKQQKILNSSIKDLKTRPYMN